MEPVSSDSKQASKLIKLGILLRVPVFSVLSPQRFFFYFRNQRYQEECVSDPSFFLPNLNLFPVSKVIEVGGDPGGGTLEPPFARINTPQVTDRGENSKCIFWFLI